MNNQPSVTTQMPPFKDDIITIRRGPWSPEEDRKLLEAIQLYGPSNWVRISQSLGSRTPKQCRERYHQNLKPSLNRNPITAEEGQLIEELVAKYGKRWAEIARHLNGRSDNAIKNWWNGGANRRRRASSHAVLQDMHREVQPLSHPQQFYRPAFNTGIFEGPAQVPQGLQQQMLPPISRAGSISQEVFIHQPGVKRLLDEHNPPARRHSAQTILTTTGSSSPFSGYSRAGSRNSSISDYNNVNSSATSRRSSLAHELFPNHMAKRPSYSSTYLSPNFSTTHGGPMPSGLMPLTPMSSIQPQQPQQMPQLQSLQPLRESVPTQQEPTMFKKEFSFNRDPVKLPPPSAIASTSSFSFQSSQDSNGTSKPENTGSADGEKNVMNISNLLV
jgi:hypothetical protein